MAEEVLCMAAAALLAAGELAAGTRTRGWDVPGAEGSLCPINLPAGSWWGKWARATNMGHGCGPWKWGNGWGGAPGLLPAASRR